MIQEESIKVESEKISQQWGPSVVLNQDWGQVIAELAQLCEACSMGIDTFVRIRDSLRVLAQSLEATR